MRIYTMFTIIGLLAFWLPGYSQLKYHAVDHLPLYGKMDEATETRYERLPVALKGVSREPVWNLGKNTAGLYLRFRSNSTSVGLKWQVLQNTSMNHMTETGIKGFDLYALRDGQWTFVNSARPRLNSTDHEALIIANMDGSAQEFMLFFPLYDGVVDVQIGVDSLAFVANPEVALPISHKPVVCYGTSILQGGCATRPGMAHTNILTRRFNREFINLGFSGNARLDYEIAELIASKEASLIILDFMPNVDVDLILERTEKFYRIIREKHPETAILFVENPIYPHSVFDQRLKQGIEAKNDALKRVFNALVSGGERNIHLVPALGMIGVDGEATIDGVHFTDLGYLRYADFLYPYIDAYIHP